MKTNHKIFGDIEQNEIYKIIASCTQDNVFVQDEELRYNLVLNPQLGINEQDIIGKTDFDLMTSKEDAEKLTKIKRQVLETGKSIHVDIPLVSKTGETEYFSGTYMPKSDSQGHTNGLIGCFRNLTESVRSENESNLFFDMVPDMIVVASSDGYFIKLNKAWENVLGFTLDELKSKPYVEFIHPDDIEPTSHQVASQLDGRSTINFSNRYICKNGDYKWLEWVAIPSPDGKKLYATARDITEKKRFLDELRKSEERFSQVAMSSGIWIWEVDKEGLYTYCSDSCESILGCKPKEIVGKKYFYDFFAPDKKKELKRVVIDQFSKQLPINRFENSNIHKDGRLVILETSAVPLLDDQGNLIGYRGTDKDITDEKLDELSIRKHANLLEMAHDSIIVRDKVSKITYWNQGAVDCYGWSKEEALGKVTHSILKTEFSVPLDEINNKLLDEGFWEGELTHRKKDGSEVIVSSRWQKRNTDDSFEIFEINNDITKRRIAEKTLFESEDKFRKAFYTNPDSITVTQLDTGRYVSVNNGFINNFGFSEKEVLGKTSFELGLWHDLVERQHFIDSLRSSKVVENFEVKLCTKQGKILYCILAASIIDIDGISYILTTTKDISEIRLAGERLKESESNLRKKNERLSAIVAAIPDLIFVIDKKGTYLEVITSEPEKLLIAPDKIIGSNISQAFNPELTSLFMLKFDKALKSKEIETIEFEISLDNSPSTHFEARIAPLDDDKLMVLSRDITKEAMKQAMINKLSVAVDQSPVSIVITDLQGNLEYVNQAFEEISGYCQQEVLGQNARILKSGKTDVSIYKNLWGSIQSGKEWHGELINKKKNGEYYWETISISPILDYKGTITNYLAVKLDITDRKHAEDLLVQNEEKYRYMFVNNPQPMWIYDLETLEFLEVNEAAIKHYDYSREEFLLMNLKDIRPKEDISALLEDVKNTRNKLNTAGEWRHLKKNGEELIVEIYSHSITYNNRSARHVLVNDITKRKQTEIEILELNSGLEERIQLRTAELAKLNGILVKEIEERKKAEIESVTARTEAEKANLAKSDFLSRMSHELRTPMNSILGFAQILEMSSINPAQKKGVSHILKSGKHLLDLINEILDISRIEAGRLSLSIEPVQVSSIILEVIDSIQLQAAEHQLSSILVSSASNQMFVNSDRQRLKQVLLNLISNAVKYNNFGGSISVETKLMPPDDNGSTSLRISISDTGPGIPAEKIPLLFNPFERIGAEKSSIEGTGLGLAVVHKLIEAMGGRNGVESVLGKGSTFWIELPTVDSQLNEASKSEIKAIFESKLAQKTGKVLYIEDNISNIELVQQILSNECPGVQLISETLGKLATLRAREHAPDLILLDLNLPDIHGSEVFRNLLEDVAISSIPVVVISADAMQVQQRKLFQLGVRNYLTKPLNVAEFLRVIDKFLIDK